MPKVSVVMPVYNTQRYVGEAIESILNQTFKDFEFIIIDDGSSDKSWEIIQGYAKQDKRIKALQNEENRGISYTRNRLIESCSTNYIATMDSDDVSMPNRLLLEYQFLSNHSKYGVVSGNNIIIDENGKKTGKRTYSDNIDYYILKKSPISQPASMFKKDIFKSIGGYDTQINYGEDYDLWIRMYAQGYKIKNLPEDLLQYRIRPKQTKNYKLKETLKNTLFIQKRAIRKYGIKQTLSDRVYHFGERILLLLPVSIVWNLFQYIEYK